jgi:hypothetical protein
MGLKKMPLKNNQVSPGMDRTTSRLLGPCSWTCLAHYFSLLIYVATAPRQTMTITIRPTVRGKLRLGDWAGTLRSVLISPPHGVTRSSFYELFAVSAQRWKQTFHDADLNIVSHQKCGLFYTGQSLLPTIGIICRQRIARIWVSSSALCDILPRTFTRLA